MSVINNQGEYKTYANSNGNIKYQTEEEEVVEPMLPLTLTHDDNKKAEKPAMRQRVVSLDILRGMTVMLMIVVNNQPTATWWPFEHADWAGFTPTDCVFPFFLFISGYAIGITTKDVHVEKRKSSDVKVNFLWFIPMNRNTYEWVWMWLRIFRRSALLFLIGISFSFLSHITNPKTTRVMGVLQRIALCNLAVNVLCVLFNSAITQMAFVAALHVVYIVTMFTVYVPGCGRGVIDRPECTAQAFIDQRILPRRNIYLQGVYDPEGFLSTLPAITTTYMGVLYFKLTQTGDKNDSFELKMYRQMSLWLLTSALLITLAFAINPYFPFNKHIWSTSFALLTPGLAGALLSWICYIVDVKQYKRYWIQPFVWVGSNPLLLYVAPTLFAITLLKIPAYYHGRHMSLYVWIYQAVYHSWIKNSRIASFLFAIVFELVWLPLAAVLHYKKIYIKL